MSDKFMASKFKFVDFLKKWNSEDNVRVFVIFQSVLQIIQICLLVVRSFIIFTWSFSLTPSPRLGVPLAPLSIIMDGRGPCLFSTSSTFSFWALTQRKRAPDLFLFSNSPRWKKLNRYFGYSNPLFLFLLLCSESVTLAGNVVICFFGTRIVRYTSIAVLFLFFLQKGCTAAYITSTIVRRNDFSLF